MGLAVGILVDDATVEIENIHRNLGQGKEIEPAILDGAAQIAVPAFVSTLAICIVFVPVVFLSGAAKSLFTPLGMAVVFAMLASYLLSRTLVPTMVKFLLASEVEMYQDHEAGRSSMRAAEECELDLAHTLPIQCGVREVSRAISRDARLGAGPCGVFAGLLCILHRALSLSAAIYRAGLLSGRRRRNFPAACADGSRHSHRRGRANLQPEWMRRFARWFPKESLGLVLDDIGIPAGGFNLAFGDGSLTDVQDGEILVSLNEDHHPTVQYRRKLREVLHKKFPDVTFYFQASDIVNQILNFGLPAPIDIQISGRAFYPNYEIAKKIRQEVAAIPGATDVHINQVVYAPELRVNVDRSRAQTIGLTESECCQQHAVRAGGQRAGIAELLAESAERRELLGRRADSAVQDGFD